MRIRTALGVSLLGASIAAAAPAPWLEIKSQHFTVVTNSGEKEGRRTLWQLEQVRQALLVIWPWANIDGGRPITIFAVRDEGTLKSLGPQYWEGKRYRPTSFWVGAVDRQYIALRTDLAEPNDIGENPYQTAYWNYISLVFHRSLPGDVPYWYGRGVADVLSNTIVREKEIHVGRLMTDRLQAVRTTPLIPLAEFLAVDRKSRFSRNETDSWQFDAQAWAFVHYLMFGERGQHRGRVDRFNQMLLKGADADSAMKEAFGPDMTPYFAGMREYIKKEIFQYARIPVSVELKAEGFSSRSLPPAESALVRAGLLVAMARPIEARALGAECAKADPASPGPFEIEASLLDQEGKPNEARAAYDKAAQLGSRRAQVFYRLAQLSRPEGAVDKAANERIAAHLQKAIELDPAFANALSMLADVKNDLGDTASALDLAQRAVTLAPDESYHRLSFARALWNAGRQEEAVGMARSAMTIADSDQERSYAQRFLDFAANSPRPAPRRGPTSSVPTPGASPIASEPATNSPDGPKNALRLDSGVAVDACISNRDNAACAKAVPMLQAQCDRGEGYACRALGSLHDGGFGVPMDKARAAQAYDAGCVAGDKGSCARYAVLQVQGLGVQHNSVEGLATLERLCGEKVGDACIGWALILAGRPEKRDVPRARSLLQTECDRPNADACRILKSLPAR